MRAIFFNRFFFPDTSATSQMLSDLAFDLASTGIEVHVVTSQVPGAEADEVVRGVHVHRVAPADTSHGLAARALDYAKYYFAARRAARHLARPGDIVVLKTDPPLLGPAMAPVAKRRGARTVLWLQDLFPEVAKAYGVPGLTGPVFASVRAYRDRALRNADTVVAICEAMASRVAHVVPPGRLQVIHNWADGAQVSSGAAAGSAVRGEWGATEKFVVAYSGNFGRVHEFDTMLDAAKELTAHDDIVFVLSGRGPRLRATRARAKSLALSNVRFEPHQPRERLGGLLAAPDLHLTVLRPEFEGLVHPSKLYGIMAAGKPTIFIGDRSGETARILATSQCGLMVQQGDGHALARAVLRLRENATERERFGENARRAFLDRYDMPIALGQWRDVLRPKADNA
jgi:glycosyltransferase involved in cell wall biosynthesis